MNSQATMSNPSHPSPHAALPHVLVVDDDPTIRDLIFDYLGKNELRVTAVADGGTMQAVLADQVVDLVVLDLKLKAEDGMALARRLTSREGRSVPLSNGEFSLLVVMLGAPNRILSRDQLLDLSRLHNDEVYNRSVDVQIMRLRRKIEKDAAEPRYIRTERGAGYLFGVPVDTIY